MFIRLVWYNASVHGVSMELTINGLKDCNIYSITRCHCYFSKTDEIQVKTSQNWIENKSWMIVLRQVEEFVLKPYSKSNLNTDRWYQYKINYQSALRNATLYTYVSSIMKRDYYRRTNWPRQSPGHLFKHHNLHLPYGLTPP